MMKNTEDMLKNTEVRRSEWIPLWQTYSGGVREDGFANRREADIVDGQPFAFGGQMPQLTSVLFFSTTLCSQSLKWSATVSECMALRCSSCRSTAMMCRNAVLSSRSHCLQQSYSVASMKTNHTRNQSTWWRQEKEEHGATQSFIVSTEYWPRKWVVGRRAPLEKIWKK